MIGWSAGLNFRNDGGAGMPAGNSGMTAAIAVCTSTAALSMLRFRSNWSVTFELPVELEDVISSMPAMVVNWRSRGLATADAIVVGSPPGRPAFTFRVGKSTLGRSLTASTRYATTPMTAMPSMMRLVAIGRLMKTSEIFTDRSDHVYAGLCKSFPHRSPENHLYGEMQRTRFHATDREIHEVAVTDVQGRL